MNFEYKKSLGQNFLKDESIINIISNSISTKQNDLIVEIGPGQGALTKKLVNKNCDILCFEIDKRLEKYLSNINSNKLKVVYEDFLKVKLNNYISKKYNRIFFVGNLPYYITTAIINKIINESTSYEIVIMIQKEVADRYMAKCGNKIYGSISVFLQYNFDIKKVCDVSKKCFIPVPKVDSKVIKLIKKENKKLADNEELFYKLVKDSFKQKRKTIKNNLKNYNLELIEKELLKYNKSLNSRAEEISVEEFVNISNILNSQWNCEFLFFYNCRWILF